MGLIVVSALAWVSETISCSFEFFLWFPIVFTIIYRFIYIPINTGECESLQNKLRYPQYTRDMRQLQRKHQPPIPFFSLEVWRSPDISGVPRRNGTSRLPRWKADFVRSRTQGYTAALTRRTQGYTAALTRPPSPFS